jgi:fatty acid desaturase
MNWEKSKSTTKTTRIESFLTCFHFDCHFEHHAMPQVPWFDLWDVKKMIDGGLPNYSKVKNAISQVSK